VQTEHVVMFEAIEARDKDAARLAMCTHIEDALHAHLRRAGRLRIAKRGAQEHEQICGRFAMSVTAPLRTGGQILA
jgi:hypothetical protein